MPWCTRSDSAPSVSSMSTFGIGPVHLVEVDVVGAEAAQAVLALAHDPAPRAARHVAVGAHRCRRTWWRARRRRAGPAIALATISSDSPAEYTSAVSMKLMPASSAAWMTAIDSSWSGLPHCAEHHRPEAQGADLHARSVRTPGTSSSPPRNGSLASHPVLRVRRYRTHGTGWTRAVRGRAEAVGTTRSCRSTGAGAGALGERVGHRVLAEQEVAGSPRAAAPPAGWSPRS